MYLQAVESEKRGCFRALVFSKYIQCSVQNKTIGLEHNQHFDLSIPKLKHIRTTIIKAFGNTLELQTFISYTQV